MRQIKLLLLVILAYLLSIGQVSCGYTHPQILLRESLNPKVEAEVGEGVYFFADRVNADYDAFVKNLTILIVEEPIMGKYAGLYVEEDLLIVVYWQGSVGKSALFHELLHHHLVMTTGEVDYAIRPFPDHTERFLAEVRVMRAEWSELHEKYTVRR